MAALLLDSARHKRLVYDEMDNLAYGRRFLREGPGAVPHGQRMPVLAFNALGCIHRQCRPSFVNRGDGTRLTARAATIVATLALGGVVWAWARALFGAGAALLALWLYVFNPNLLAHGKQVTSDVQAALFTTTAAFLLWRLLRRWSAVTFVGTAAAASAAILAKMTNVLLLPVLAGPGRGADGAPRMEIPGAWEVVAGPRAGGRLRRPGRARRQPGLPVRRHVHARLGPAVAQPDAAAAAAPGRTAAPAAHVPVDARPVVRRAGGPEGGPEPELRARRAEPGRPLVRLPPDGPVEDAAGPVRAAGLEPGGESRGRGLAPRAGPLAPRSPARLAHLLQPGREAADRRPLPAADVSVPLRPGRAHVPRLLAPRARSAGRPVRVVRRLQPLVPPAPRWRTSTS